jgi:hypothetical protein
MVASASDAGLDYTVETFEQSLLTLVSVSGKRDSDGQRQLAQNRLQAGNCLHGDRNADAGARQLRAFWKSRGNLAVRKSAWWARKDSNHQPDRYERLAGQHGARTSLPVLAPIFPRPPARAGARLHRSSGALSAPQARRRPCSTKSPDRAAIQYCCDRRRRGARGWRGCHGRLFICRTGQFRDGWAVYFTTDQAGDEIERLEQLNRNRQ